jgi:hypothetical protein
MLGQSRVALVRISGRLPSNSVLNHAGVICAASARSMLQKERCAIELSVVCARVSSLARQTVLIKNSAAPVRRLLISHACQLQLRSIIYHAFCQL